MGALVQPLPARLGGLTSGAAVLSGVAYDVVIGGIPFLSANTPEEPHVRETAPYRREQQDTTAEAGEQSLGGWWYRSQSSFHGGAGLRYLDPAGAEDPVARTRFEDSRSVDPWTPGVLSRLPDTTRWVSTGAAGTRLAAGYKGTTDYVLLAAGTTLTALALTSVGSASTLAVTWGGSGTITGLACDGANYYISDSAGIWTGPVDNSSAGTKLYNLSSPATVVLAWVKQRLMACVDRSVYQLAATGAGLSLPTALYTHPVAGWTWTCLSEEPQAILAGGYLGGESGIVRFALDTQGGAPTLTAGAEAAKMPTGERVHSLRLLAGTWLGIGTSRGFRVGTFESFAGRLQYGPLSVRTPSPVLAVGARGDFFYAGGTAAVDGGTESGLVRVSPGTPTDQSGTFAYATDLVCEAVATGAVTGVASTVNGNRMVFSVDGYGLLLEDVGPGSLRTAWLRTARVRFSTTEPKLYKRGLVRGTFDGELKVWAVPPSGSETLVLDHVASPLDPEQFALVPGPLPWLALRIEFLTEGGQVALHEWQVKALPAARRERMLQLVLSCSDREADKRGQEVHRPGYGYARLLALEELEESGDEVTCQLFLPEVGAVNRQCVIDRISFRQARRPTQTQGQSGKVTVLLRTVS